MKVYLSPQKPEADYNAWISNIATLDGQVLDSEATQIIADQFFSMFNYHEVDQIISKVSKKMRLFLLFATIFVQILKVQTI